MLVVIAPAKKLDFTTMADPELPCTRPAMLKSTKELVAVMQEYDREGLAALMKISDRLAEENVERYRKFVTPFKPDNAKQAVLAFSGDTYLGLDAGSFTVKDHDYAQEHLRILLGLYGLLRPLDLVQPYRLEMGLGLKTARGASLYEFWGSSISRALDRAIGESGSPYLLNCASKEYMGAVERDRLKAKVITPVFKQVRNGEARMIGRMAKRARGALARFMIENRINDPAGLKDFRAEGYRYRARSSTPETLEFHRRD